MISFKLRVFLLFLAVFFFTSLSAQAIKSSPMLFREYIGAEFKDVKFTDVPINPNVNFHFILSFAYDYDNTTSPPSPTNGRFNIFWDTVNLSPSHVSSIKAEHSNVKVALSLGGDTVGDRGAHVFFTPSSVDSWVKNAVVSLTKIIKDYNLDGIDIDYEHFNGDPNTFRECIGKLIATLKRNKVIKFASIAPFEEDDVQRHYQALWKKYAYLIDYVNFQFYAYEKGITVSEFLRYFDIQASNYKGGNMLVSFGTDQSGGLKPRNGFFSACRKLMRQGKLNGIFIWSADDSKDTGFQYERQSQAVLATPRCSLQPYLPCDVVG